MALKDKIPKIIQHVDDHRDFLQFNYRLYKMYEGQIKKEVEDSLREELISTTAYNRAIKRIPSINIVRKAVDKLAKVYVEPPTRLTDNESDKEIMDNIIKSSDIDVSMTQANKIYNLHRGCLIEPFVKRNKVQFRILAFHQFLPFGDDPTDPTEMTVLIKFLGREKKLVKEIQYDKNGNITTEDEIIKNVEIMALYSDDEFMIIDSTGSLRLDKMAEFGTTSTVNPFGVIPGVYVNSSKFELVPFPNQEAFDISILIPKLLTDLNYAAQFMSHSIIWTKNTDVNGQEFAPDVCINLGDDDADGGSPEMGTINPKVEYESVLQLVEFLMSGYFSSIGIKTSTVGSMMPGREASGFAKAMDEGDVTSERKTQTEFFRNIEHELWEKVSKMQSVWSRDFNLIENRTFSENFAKTFSIKFGEMKIMKSRKQLLDEIKLEKEEKLIGRRQALRLLHPDFTEVQIDKWIEELDKDAEDAMDKMMGLMEQQGNQNKEEPKSGLEGTADVQRKETLGK